MKIALPLWLVVLSVACTPQAQPPKSSTQELAKTPAPAPAQPIAQIEPQIVGKWEWAVPKSEEYATWVEFHPDGTAEHHATSKGKDFQHAAFRWRVTKEAKPVLVLEYEKNLGAKFFDLLILTMSPHKYWHFRREGDSLYLSTVQGGGAPITLRRLE